MSEILDKLLAASFEFLKIAKEMQQRCLEKKNKVYSDSRYIISFFFKRAIEMFESFIVLIKEQRWADSAILLRSFWEMGISTGYIYKDPKEKELNALRYLLDENEVQKKIINANLQDFKEIDSNIESRRDEIREEVDRIKKELCKKYCEQDWKLPSIEERTKQSGSIVLKQAYNQIYRYLSNIEHHNIFFGRNYVNKENCEPLEEIKEVIFLSPEVNLFMFRIIFLVILKTFNEEFQLKWKDKLSELEKTHDEEYQLLKEKVIKRNKREADYQEKKEVEELK